MKLRTLVVVVIVLTALSATVFIAHRRDSSLSKDNRESQPLADAATLERAAKVRIMDQGKTVTLTRQSDGSWSVTSYFDLPANFSMISGLVGSLVESKLLRLVTTNTERLARLGLSDTQITFFDSGGKELWSAMLGKYADGGGRFLRYGTEPKAYLTNFSGGLEAESKNWANPQLLSLNANDISSVEVTLDGGSPMLFSRTNKDAIWTSDQTPIDKNIDASRIAFLLSSLGNIRFSETKDLSDPQFSEAKVSTDVFKLTFFDGKTVHITFRQKPAQKDVNSVVVEGASVSRSPGSVGDLTAKKNPSILRGGPPLPGSPISAGPIPIGGPTPSPVNARPPAFPGSPADPVFVVIDHSDTAAPINAMMKQRAFQIEGDSFPGLPKKADDFFVPAVPPRSKKTPE